MTRDIPSVEAVASGDRRALARAITLVESAKPAHREAAEALLAGLPKDREALRIGLSGTPGVGKSTFLEAFGLFLTGLGHRVAVLAVDPSSTRSGGSILGDKTRMEQLSRDPNAFIRPSPSQSHLGGVARRTRDVIALCEGAGFDVVLVETVGVGQSETMVAEMTDIFALLMAPAGGDELQGVKRGIMEIADLVVVNKADGDLKAAATRTCADYAGALRLLRKRARDPEGYPKALMASALLHEGLEPLWADIETLANWRKAQGVWDARRAAQAVHWFEMEVREALLSQLSQNETARSSMRDLSQMVHAGDETPNQATQKMLAILGIGQNSAAQ